MFRYIHSLLLWWGKKCVTWTEELGALWRSLAPQLPSPAPQLTSADVVAPDWTSWSKDSAASRKSAKGSSGQLSQMHAVEFEPWEEAGEGGRQLGHPVQFSLPRSGTLTWIFTAFFRFRIVSVKNSSAPPMTSAGSSHSCLTVCSSAATHSSAAVTQSGCKWGKKVLASVARTRSRLVKHWHPGAHFLY